MMFLDLVKRLGGDFAGEALVGYAIYLHIMILFKFSYDHETFMTDILSKKLSSLVGHISYQ